MKKVLIIVGSLILTGCASQDLINSYENMQISEDKINGYNLELRVSGALDNVYVDEIVRIKNYNNEQYEIVVNSSNGLVNEDALITPETDTTKPENEYVEPSTELDKNKIYIKDGEVYTKEGNGQYSINTAMVKYSNPSIYLEGLKNISKSSKTGNEKIGDKTYKKYDIVINREIAKDILKDIGFANAVINKDAGAIVYLDSNKMVYKIIYNINRITINACYFGINKATPINFPAGI